MFKYILEMTYDEKGGIDGKGGIHVESTQQGETNVEVYSNIILSGMGLLLKHWEDRVVKYSVTSPKDGSEKRPELEKGGD